MWDILPKPFIAKVLIRRVKDFVKGVFGGKKISPQDINWALFDIIEESLDRARRIDDLEMLRGKKKNSEGFVPFTLHDGEDEWRAPGKTPIYARGNITIIIDWQEFEGSLASRTDEYLADMVSDALRDKSVRRKMFASLTSKRSEEMFESIIGEKYHKGKFGNVIEEKVSRFVEREIKTNREQFSLFLQPPKVLKDKSSIDNRSMTVSIDLLWSIKFPGFHRP